MDIILIKLGRLLDGTETEQKAGRIMLDVINLMVDTDTTDLAGEIERDDPQLWKDTQWLRMVGGTTRFTREWQEYLRDELEQEIKDEQTPALAG